MVNKTKFYKTKVALAVVLSLGLAACGDSDGDVSTATSQNTADASQPTEVNQVAKGSIQGVVLDTNGQPILGATVTTAGKTVTTDASGSYYFADLPVSNVVGADDDTTNGAFTVVIQAPAGYASTATVQVSPSAQIDAANGGTNNGASTIPLTTFIDGFLATAPTAVMPKKESIVEGWVRDDNTGEAIVGAQLSLDFVGISTITNSVVVGNPATTPNATISGDLATTTTNAEGYYRFENVYNDSSFNLSITDYAIQSTAVDTANPVSASVVEVVSIGSTDALSLTTSNTPTSITSLTVNGVNKLNQFIIVDGVISDINLGGKVDVVSVTEIITVPSGADVNTIATSELVNTVTSVVAQDGGAAFGNTKVVNGVIYTLDNSDVAGSDGDTYLVTYTTKRATLPAGASVTVAYDYNLGAVSTTTVTNDGIQTTSTFTGVTTAESIENNLGDLLVSKIVSNDTISPYVSNVTGWIKTSADGYGILNEGVDKTFTVWFSEPVNAATFNKTDLLVTDSTSTILATEAVDGVVLAADGRSVTINLAEAQEPGAKISIFMPWQDATDVAGNFFSTTANDSMDIDFDSRQNSTSGKASFLRVNLCVFLPAVINPTGFSAEQHFDHTAGTDAGSTDLAEYSNAFLDDQTTTGDTDVRQLNGDASDTDAFLTALGSLVAGSPITVDSDHAAVNVALGEASAYSFTGSGGAVTTKRVYFDGVEHGDKVKFTFYNDLALAAGTATVTLVDQVKPTTILQENYELFNEAGYAARIVTSGVVENLGAGGEVTEVGVEATKGNPIIYVQPRHITPVDEDTNQAIRGTEWNDLTANMVSRLGTGETGNLRTFVDGATPNPIYDDAAFAAWTARANSLGFAFSEDVAMAGSANVIFSGANNLIGNYSAIANVENNVDNTANLVGKNDLVRAEVSDYLALANENHNETVSFSGDVEDLAGNVADDNSRATVVLRDAFPPMATNVSWEGTEIIMTFNEPVAPVGVAGGSVPQTVIVVDDLDILTPNAAAANAPDTAPVSITLDSTLTAPAAGAYTLSADGKTLTVSVNGTSINVLMETGASNEFLYEEDGDSTEEENHAAIAWDNLNDANGNDWETFDNDTDVALARHEVNAPRFMMYDNVGTFTVGYSFFNLVANDDNFNISITFTHPIDTTPGNAFDLAADSGNNNIFFDDGASEINTTFFIDIDGDTVGAANTVDDIGFPAGTTAALSGDKKRIDIVMPTTTALSSTVTLGTSIFRGIPTVESAITGQIRTITETINN